MSGPGPEKIPLNLYVTRQHKANLKRDAFHRGVAMSEIVLELLDKHSDYVKKKYGLPKKAPIFKAPWIERRRKASAKRATKKAKAH
jgi:hypothetical protein